jgi:hypothetical protein
VFQIDVKRLVNTYRNALRVLHCSMAQRRTLWADRREKHGLEFLFSFNSHPPSLLNSFLCFFSLKYMPSWRCIHVEVFCRLYSTHISCLCRCLLFSISRRCRTRLRATCHPSLPRLLKPQLFIKKRIGRVIHEAPGFFRLSITARLCSGAVAVFGSSIFMTTTPLLPAVRVDISPAVPQSLQT